MFSPPPQRRRYLLALSAVLHLGALAVVAAFSRAPASPPHVATSVPVALLRAPLYQPQLTPAQPLATPSSPSPSRPRKRQTPTPHADPHARENEHERARGHEHDTLANTDTLAASPSSPSSSSPAAALAHYLTVVLRPIIANTVYPEEAERLGLEGRFIVRISIDRTGRVTDARLIGVPPHSLLRRSAFAALAASAPLPPPPLELGPVVSLDVPFVYRLDG